jgi:hypothetical protein
MIQAKISPVWDIKKEKKSFKENQSTNDLKAGEESLKLSANDNADSPRLVGVKKTLNKKFMQNRYKFILTFNNS